MSVRGNIMYEYKLFKVDDGFGFKIISDEIVVQEQPYKPRVSGFEIMTEDEAIAEANATIERMVG